MFHNIKRYYDKTLKEEIKEAQAALKNCVVWYEVVNLESGTVNIIYKEV